MNSNPSLSRSFWKTEDGTAMLMAFFLLTVAVLATAWSRPPDAATLSAEYKQLESQAIADNTTAESRDAATKRMKEIDGLLGPQHLKKYWLRISDWKSNPLSGFQSKAEWQWLSFIATGVVLTIALGVCCLWQGRSLLPFLFAFAAIYLLTVTSFVLASQEVLKYANLEYPLWALLVGLLIANTIGTPRWIQPAVSADLYVKIGLVFLGAEVIFGKLLILGLPGILVSWTVTPIVLITTFWFGQKVLRISSPSLNMVISADMSVCGVSAAIASASACRAKKEELSLAIALSLVFTVVMMIVMPYGIRWLGLNPVVAGAWLGGTIDSTGAVAAASELLKSQTATEVASTVKMIQNILIGIFAIAIAAYWATYMEVADDDTESKVQANVGFGEIWRRFPKFALGFLGVSLIFSSIQASGVEGNALINGVVDGTTKQLRAWFFCMAFVSIGLDSNFRQYVTMLRSGKPIVLYLVGQALNLALSFIACYVVFQILFRETTERLMR